MEAKELRAYNISEDASERQKEERDIALWFCIKGRPIELAKIARYWEVFYGWQKLTLWEVELWWNDLSKEEKEDFISFNQVGG